MRKLNSNISIAAGFAIATVTAFQVAGARAPHLNGAAGKFRSDASGLQPGYETVLEGWSKKKKPYLAGVESQAVATTLGLHVNGVVERGFLSARYVTESGDKNVDYYFALGDMTSSLPAKHLTVEVDGFKGLRIEVGYRDDLGGTVAPLEASRSKSGDAITFTYDASKLPLTNAPVTKWAVIHTNSRVTPQWNTGRAIISTDGTVQKTIQTFAPQAPSN